LMLFARHLLLEKLTCIEVGCTFDERVTSGDPRENGCHFPVSQTVTFTFYWQWKSGNLKQC
jgi:hypothetical protein